MSEDIEIEELQVDQLAQLVKSRFEEASSAKSAVNFSTKGLNTWLIEAFNRYEGTQSNAKYNLTAVKVGILYAKVKDMTVTSVDAPFTIAPTPIPELSKDQTESIQDTVAAALLDKMFEVGAVKQGLSGELIPNFELLSGEGELALLPEVKAWLTDQARKQEKTKALEASKYARDAAKEVHKLMSDQLLEGGWKDSYLDMFFELILLGTGILRQETKSIKTLKWRNGKLEPDQKDTITWRHVPATNAYPSPNARSASEGRYFIEKTSITKQELYRSRKAEGFDEEVINTLLSEEGADYDWLGASEHDFKAWPDNSSIDMLIHEGVVQGRELLEYITSEPIDTKAFYEAEVYVVGGLVVGSRLREDNDGSRSYFSANYKMNGSSFWGLGIAQLCDERELMLNSILNDLEYNTNLSVAPPILCNASAFENPKEVGVLTPRAVLYYNTDQFADRSAPPYHQIRFDSKAAELTNLFNFHLRLADDETGVPSFLSGNTSLFGGEATFRGMKLLSSNANITIKSAFHNIDKGIIQPLMEHLWRHNMMDDKVSSSMKADVRVVARGSSGLVQREIADAEKTEALPIIAQLLTASSLDEQTQKQLISSVLANVMTSAGMPTEQFFKDLEVEDEQAAAVASLAPATAQPTIGADTNTGGFDVS